MNKCEHLGHAGPTGAVCAGAVMMPEMKESIVTHQNMSTKEAVSWCTSSSDKQGELQWPDKRCTECCKCLPPHKEDT